METWLTDVKQLRIPRPKFGSMGSPPNSCYLRRPYEPPQDYNSATENFASSPNPKKLDASVEEVRRTLQEKL